MEGCQLSESCTKRDKYTREHANLGAAKVANSTLVVTGSEALDWAEKARDAVTEAQKNASVMNEEKTEVDRRGGRWGRVMAGKHKQQGKDFETFSSSIFQNRHHEMRIIPNFSHNQATIFISLTLNLFYPRAAA